MAPRTIQIIKKKKAEPTPKPKRHIVINKPGKPKDEPKPEPKPKRKVVINKKPQATAKPNQRVVVKKKQAPAPSKPTSSTNPIHIVAHTPVAPRLHKHKHKSNPMLKLIPFGIAALAVIILTVVVSKNSRKSSKRRTTSEYIDQDDKMADNLLASIALSEAKEWVQAFVKENPDGYDEIIARFQSIIDKYPNEISAKMAARHVARWQKEKQKAVDACMVKLEKECKVLIADKKFEEAITEFMEYDGLYAVETLEKRSSNADKIRMLVKKINIAAGKKVLDRALNALLSGTIEDTAAFVLLYTKKYEHLLEEKEWQQLVELLDSATKVPEIILKSFENQIGETVTVDLITGSLKIQVSGVKNGNIQHSLQTSGAKITKEISLDSLSEKERLLRLKDNLSGIAIIKAIESAQKKDFTTAKKYLELVPSPLQEHIIERLDNSQLSKVSEAASLQLSQALTMANINVTPPYNFKAALKTLKSSDLTPGMELLLYSIANNVYRYSNELPWYKEDDNYALMQHLLSFKPTDDETEDDDWVDNSFSEDKSEGSPSNDSNDSNPVVDHMAVDNNIDWRKQIDF